MISRSIIFKVAAAVLAMAGIFPAMASGWGATWLGIDLERTIREAAIKLGPLSLKPVLDLAGAGFDSNVYRAQSHPLGDYTLTVGPSLSVYFPIRETVVFSVKDSLHYVYFHEAAKERTWNNYFSGQVDFVFNRLFFSLGTGFSVSRELWNMEIDARLQRREFNLLGSALWQASKKTAFAFKASRTTYDYEDLSYEKINFRDELNRSESYFDFTTYYRLSPKTRLFLDFEHGSFVFEKPSSFRDSRSYAVYGGAEFSPSGAVSGRIQLGYKAFDLLTRGMTGYDGFSGNSSVTVRPTETMIFRAMYGRSVEFSVWSVNPYFLESVLGGGLSIYPFKNIRLDYDYSSGRDAYPERTDAADGAPDRRRDNYRMHSAAVFFRLMNRLAVGVTFNLWVRESNLGFANADRSYVGVSLIRDF